MARVFAILFGIAACAALAGIHEARALDVTPAQVEACYPDAVRLCGAPKDRRLAWPSFEAMRIAACMFAKQAQISKHCRAAFGR